MRVLLAAGLMLSLVTGPAIAQPQRARTPSTLRYLNERISEISFEDAPFDQVLDWIGEVSPMQIQPRWQALEDAGIERDKPITMRLRNLRLSQVLYEIMNEASGPDLTLAYKASGNLLILSTQEDLAKEMVTQVYDVSDLLVRVPRFRGAPQLDLQQQSGQAGGVGGTGGGQNIFGGQGSSSRDEEDERDRDDNADIEQLIDLIIQVVEPDSWALNGGRGTIHHFRNQLVVYNNIFVHQQLGGYVEERD